MNLNKTAEKAFRIALRRQQNGGNVDLLKTLNHLAGEVVEAAVARVRWLCVIDKNNDKIKAEYAEELADIIICALTAARSAGVDIESAVNEKMRKNELRAELKGDKK
jgi:NTP pyrophosphatase (non-canonical NTP hydrolase)